MSDLEELLRTDLRDAADTLPADLDVDALLDQGHRLRRARAGRRSLAAVAAVVVVSLAGWAGLAHRTTTGVPDPASTPTGADAVGFVTFEGDAGYRPRSPYASITVRESNGMLTLAVRKRASDPPTILATVPLKTDQATTTAISSRLMLATIPGPTQWVDVVTSDAAKGAFRPNVGFLSSVGVTVVVQVADEAQQSKRWVDGLVWRASDGTLHSSAGSVVSTATLDFSDGPLTVYRDPGLAEVSYFDTLSGKGFASTRDHDPADVVKLNMSKTGTPGDSEQFALGILPPGAHDPRVTTSAKGAEVVTGVLQPDGAVVFVARYRSDAKPKGPLITKVVYTDAGGQTRTYRP